MSKLPVDYTELSQPGRRAVREQYIAGQEGKCWHCKHSLSELPPDEITSKRITWSKFPPQFLRHPIHLHHDHDTGMTIGAVHAFCNAYLWEYHEQ